MRRFFVEIADDAFDALADMALQERRDVRDQAAILIEQRLRAARESQDHARRALMAPRTEKHAAAVPA
jgi:hypothetical protein